MKIAIIDTETTDLSPKTGQIIEVGIVIDDTEHMDRPLAELPTFHTYVLPKRGTEVISGNPIALSMNAKILAEIAGFFKNTHEVQDNALRQGVFSYPDNQFNDGLVVRMRQFFHDNDIVDSVIAGGKNFAGFDRRFLEAVEGWDIRFKHRTFDPMPWFVEKGDKAPPDLSLCLKRAGIEGTVAHTAVEDAMQCAALIRVGFERNTNMERLIVR